MRKFHQVKRMFTAIGSEVLFLVRITFGALPLDESQKQVNTEHLPRRDINITTKPD